jgi:hypothetical protein
VFKNRVLRETFDTYRENVTGDWRRLHDEDLHDWKSSWYIIRAIKSRKMRWMEHVASMGKGGEFRVFV